MESVSKTEPKASRSFIPIIAILGGIIAIGSLFIYWVDISTTFSYSFFEIPYTMKATAIKVVEGSTDIPDDWHTFCPAIGALFAIIGAIIGIVAIIRKGANKWAYFAIFLCGLLALQFSIFFAAWNFDVMYVVTAEDQGNIQNLSVVLQAALGDPASMEMVRQGAIAQAIAGGMDPAVAETAITSDVALQAALEQVQTTLGLDLTNPEVIATLSAANPADFVAGNELVVGYMEVQDVVTDGFWLCIAGGVLVTLTGAVGFLKALKK